MIQGFIVWFLKISPKTKRWFWRFWYDLFAQKSGFHKFRFMNYGYAEQGFSLSLLEQDEDERYPLQLYHHTATQINITNKKALEVGSGRGGGASYLQRYLKTSSFTGVDISEKAISLCKNSFNISGLHFEKADSENLPFENSTFDVIINIESSHCYGNIDKFISEVFRVLKDDGVFLWCDFRTHEEMKKLFLLFKESGFKVIKEKNITKNVIEALNMVTSIRKKQINKYIPRLMRNVFTSYAGIKGGSVYAAFLNDSLVYKSAALKKTNI